jgi:hypothetical protein
VALIAPIAVTGWDDSARGLPDVSPKRFADVNLIVGESALLIASDVAFVAGVWLDQFAAAGHSARSLWWG